MLGNVTGISWASFTIASRVERGCFCLEDQNPKKFIDRIDRNTCKTITLAMAGNVNSLAWFARLTFVRGRSVPSLPNVLQSWVAPEALPWRSPQTHFGAHCSLLPSGSSTHPASLPASHLLLSQGCTSPWPTNGPVPLAPGVNYTLEPKQAAWPLPPTRFATAQGVASPSSSLCHWSILELGFGNPPLPVEPSEEWESTEVRLTSLTLLNRDSSQDFFL